MFVVVWCCALFLVCCWLLSVVRCGVLVAASWLFVGYVMYVVLFVACCVLCAACCLLLFVVVR